MTPRIPHALIVSIALTVGGCTQTTGLVLPVFQDAGSKVQRTEVDGQCFATETLPAVIETVTQRDIKKPKLLAADGSVRREATYNTTEQQNIVSERQTMTFLTPCDAVLTPDFIAALQRALKARGYFSGIITGKMDARTKSAVRSYQATKNFPATTLATDTAKKLGLIEYTQEELADL